MDKKIYEVAIDCSMKVKAENENDAKRLAIEHLKKYPKLLKTRVWA